MNPFHEKELKITANNRNLHYGFFINKEIIMGALNLKAKARLKRKKRIRKKISGTSLRPRLSVFRSSKHISVQLIDDQKGITLCQASTMEKAFKDLPKFDNKTSQATYIGKLIAERAKEKGIGKVIFDRNGFMYHGRVKAVSAGAREGGLEF
jgi:large subunit ribosomal protein L18